MRLGIGTYSFAWNILEGRMDVPDLLAEARRLGAEVVQFCENLPIDARPADAEGLRLEIGTRGLDPDMLRERIKVAAAVGSPILRLVMDTPGDEPTPEEAVARLRPIVDEAHGNGVTIAIENHDRFPAPTLVEMIQALGPDRVGICLDTANSLGCLEGYRETTRLLARYTRCLHVKDVRAARFSHMMGFTIEGTVAGTGSLDIPWILETLRENGFEGSVILEQWPPVQHGQPPLAAERQMATQSMQYLRNIVRAG